MRGALLICKKEFMELSKDRKTLFFAFVMPILLWPLIVTMMMALGKSDEQQRHGKASRVYLVDPAGVVRPLMEADGKHFELVARPEGDLRQALKDQKLDLAVEVPSDAPERLNRQETYVIKATLDGSDKSSELALKRLQELMESRNKEIVSTRLEALHASNQLITPARIDSVDAADAGLQMGKALGSFLPYLLLLMMFTGSMQPGIYATAGEKERGTLQSLLSTRVPRNQIILGKLLYVFSMGVISAVMNLLSMGFTVTRLIGAAMAEGGSHGAPAGLPTINPSVLVLSFLIMIPLGLLFANFIVFMGIQARNTQEAGTALMPGMFFVVFMGVFSMAPGLEKMAWVPFVPVMNVSLAIRKIFSQQGDPFQYVLAFAMTVVLAGLMTWVAARMLDRESAIFKQS